MVSSKAGRVKTNLASIAKPACMTFWILPSRFVHIWALTTTDPLTPLAAFLKGPRLKADQRMATGRGSCSRRADHMMIQEASDELPFEIRVGE